MKSFLSRPYSFYLALLPFGISLGFNFQITYLSSVFKFFGAEASQLSYLWLAPAITGLLVQPVIGQISDATKTRYKRRPYMPGSGALAVLSYVLIPSLCAFYIFSISAYQKSQTYLWCFIINWWGWHSAYWLCAYADSTDYRDARDGNIN